MVARYTPSLGSLGHSCEDNAFSNEAAATASTSPHAVVEEAQGDGQYDVAMLTVDQLLAGGMHRVQAWIHKPPTQNKKKARNERYRELQAVNGLQQVSVRIPTELAVEFKAIAAEACQSRSLPIHDTAGLEAKAENAIHAARLAEIRLENFQVEMAQTLDRLERDLERAECDQDILQGQVDAAHHAHTSLQERIRDLQAANVRLRHLAALGAHVDGLSGIRRALAALALLGS